MLFSGKDMVRLLVPLIVEQLLAVLVGMVDVVMVAAVGEAAVSGVALVDSISILVIQMLAALATGGAVVCAPGERLPRGGTACDGNDAGVGSDHCGRTAGEPRASGAHIRGGRGCGHG